MRDRFINAIETRIGMSQEDCITVYHLHFNIFGKPAYKPNSDCNWDTYTWRDMIKNLNNAL